MTRLSPAIAVRRRQLDQLRLALAAEEERRAASTREAAALSAQVHTERLGSSDIPVSADAWFAAARARLSRFEQDASEAGQRLTELRAVALDARARLSLLEEAEEEARRGDLRRRDGLAQDALDDRTSALWSRR